MRATPSSFFVFALATLGVGGCEGVPDLVFGADDATAPNVAALDATLGADDGAPSSDATIPPSDDATLEDAAGDVGAPPDDAAAPVDGPPPPNGCPGNPPAGAICCGAVACKGNAQNCNCALCAYCASEGGVCCPSTHPPPGYCATDVKDCH
jgi:hypothetical protein